MKYATLGTVQAGRLRIVDRQAFETAFASWPDGAVWATFESAMVFRSPLQNRHWHAAIVQPLARHCGVSPRHMHEALKILYLPESVPIRRADGSVLKTVTIGGTTTTLSRGESANMTDRATELLRVVSPADVASRADDDVSHFIPYDAPALGGDQFRALCGVLTFGRQHDYRPTCTDCAAKLADESTP